ncbi:MAG: ferric reductase-like transmembrane domain-containing protein [Anaerolineales bacterium]
MNPSNLSYPANSARKTRISSDFLAFGLVAIILGLAGLVLASSASSPLKAASNWFLNLNSEKTTWYLTRSAGIVSYLLLWLSTVWGLLIPTKLLGNLLSGEFTFDFHKFISLLSLVFLGLHIAVLTADQYMPFTLSQLIVPFTSPYRPQWIGIGVISFYILLLVTVTFYLRKRIGMKTFRYIHYSSLLAYLGAVLHAFMSGTDSSLPAVMFIYIATFSIVIYFTVYWLVNQLVFRQGIKNKPNHQQYGNPITTGEFK